MNINLARTPTASWVMADSGPVAAANLKAGVIVSLAVPPELIERQLYADLRNIDPQGQYSIEAEVVCYNAGTPVLRLPIDDSSLSSLAPARSPRSVGMFKPSQTEPAGYQNLIELQLNGFLASYAGAIPLRLYMTQVQIEIRSFKALTTDTVAAFLGCLSTVPT